MTDDGRRDGHEPPGAQGAARANDPAGQLGEAREAREAQKMEAVGRLAGGIAHDFNNMLSVILSYTEILLEDLPPDSPLRPDAEEIRTAGTRAGDLTRQLLTFSSQQALEPKVLDLNESVAGVEKMLRRLLGADVGLTCTLAPDLGKVFADPGQIEQILVSLAIGAREAMPTGGTLTIETANALPGARAELPPGASVTLAVTDSGPGTAARGTPGNALGLAPVLEIVSQLGGRHRVQGHPDGATTVTVSLPRVARPAGGRDSTTSEPPAIASPQGTETILLVEDDDQVRAAVRSALRRRGYVVLDADGAGDALLVGEQHPATIHLLLADVALHRLDGRQLAARLAAARPGMKVLLLAGSAADAASRQEALGAGIAFLPKPFTPASLSAKVRAVLSGGRRI